MSSLGAVFRNAIKWIFLCQSLIKLIHKVSAVKLNHFKQLGLSLTFFFNCGMQILD